MKPGIRALCVLAALGLISVAIAVPALASARPVVTGLSTHHAPYWGGTLITVRGHDFTDVRKVLFGTKSGYSVHVVSSTKLTVRDPEHKYSKVHVRVVTAAGTSWGTSADWFTFTRPTMNTPIQGGLTARQEQRISSRVRATHRGVYTARRSSHWTVAMGQTAMKRARSWIGLPYSWAGGNIYGPTPGVCAHNGGDMDCHVIGFDCSGLALYAWAPYEHLVHYAATQYRQAGRFHPTIGELMPGDLVFFSGYLPHGIGHVAVYAGHGWVIQAAQSGTQVMSSRLVDVIAESGTYRGATRPMSTGRQGAVPHLSAMTSQLSVKGGYITIYGSHLSGATSVSVGGTLLYAFAKRSYGRLVVKAPAHAAGNVSVVVSNPWGAARRTLTYVGPPQLSTLAPSSGPTSGGTAVTLTGRFLNTVSKVVVGTSSVRFAVLGSNRLTLTTPAHAAGSVAVTVYSRFGTSNRKVYTFVAPPPPTSAAPARSRATAPASTTSPPPSTTSPPPSTTSPPPSTSAPTTPEPSSPTSSTTSQTGTPTPPATGSASG